MKQRPLLVEAVVIPAISTAVAFATLGIAATVSDKVRKALSL